jgi:hypothetical protein
LSISLDGEETIELELVEGDCFCLALTGDLKVARVFCLPLSTKMM